MTSAGRKRSIWSEIISEWSKTTSKRKRRDILPLNYSFSTKIPVIFHCCEWHAQIEGCHLSWLDVYHLLTKGNPLPGGVFSRWPLTVWKSTGWVIYVISCLNQNLGGNQCNICGIELNWLYCLFCLPRRCLTRFFKGRASNWSEGFQLSVGWLAPPARREFSIQPFARPANEKAKVLKNTSSMSLIGRWLCTHCELWYYTKRSVLRTQFYRKTSI